MADQNTILAESGLVNALYGEAGTQAAATANANALTLTAEGDAAEANQYGMAGAIGTQNAAIAQISGQIQQFQNTRLLMKTLGAQRAGVAGSGFQQSGSAIDLARSSLQQGLLQNQVIGTNATLEAGGYFQQAAASAAEASAATAASGAATANAAGATNVANLAAGQMNTTGQFLASMPGAINTLNGVLNQPNSTAFGADNPQTNGQPQSFGFGGGVSYTPLWGTANQSVTLPGIGSLTSTGINATSTPTVAAGPTAPTVAAGPASNFQTVI